MYDLVWFVFSRFRFRKSSSIARKFENVSKVRNITLRCKNNHFTVDRFY